MKKIRFAFLLGLCGFLFCNCSIAVVAATGNTVPYSISGEMVLESSSVYNTAGFEFMFYNGSEKSVSGFTVVFYLFDEDGEVPLTGRNNIVLSVDSEVSPYSMVELCVSLDKYLSYIPEVPYTVDFLYVSSISYEDSSKWTDPFGLKTFR